MRTNFNNTMTTTNSIFGSAKVAQPKAKAEKDIFLLTEESHKGINSLMEDFVHGNLALKQMEASVKLAHTELLNIGKSIFINEITKQRKYIGSFNIKAENGLKVMVMPTDKYTKVENDKFAYLSAKYQGNVKEKIEYSFNSEVLERNQEIIENLLMNCDLISDYDKANLLTAKISYEVKKGTIEQLYSMQNPAEALQDFSPIFMLKNV